MKVLVALAVLCFLQAVAGAVTKAEAENEGVQGVAVGPKPEQQNVALQQQQVASQQNVVEELKPSESSKVPAEIQAKVQQVVDAVVSQQKPQVVTQATSSKQRMMRSVRNHLTWQDMQVNAIEQPGKCEFICNPLDTTVCGYNGRCYWEFESQCDLSTYNCLNTERIFHVVDFAKCQDESTAKCYRGDM